jgi:hypothetical protein
LARAREVLPNSSPLLLQVFLRDASLLEGSVDLSQSIEGESLPGLDEHTAVDDRHL